MAINIEKMRADMSWEARKFVISAILASAALVGAGIALSNWARPASPPQPQPIIIQVPTAPR